MKLASWFALALTFLSAAPSGAHQPVNLSSAHKKVATSPVLVDGDISWAIYVDLNRTNQVRYFRFALQPGERLKAEYLTLDKAPENAMRASQLPSVTIKSPSGSEIRLPINERSKFFEPYGGKNYLFRSRLNLAGEAGIYTVAIRSKRAAQIVVAVGAREVRGEVMTIGTAAPSCPLPIAKESEIPLTVARQLVGLSERAGELCAEINRWGIRIAMRDGEAFPLTMDYRFDRINLSIERGIIVDVTVG